MIEITKWDMADNIKTKEDVILYLETAFEEGDLQDIISVLGAVSRSQGMTQIAKETGVTRESLYRSLSENGNPSFATVMKVLKALGLSLRVIPAA